MAEHKVPVRSYRVYYRCDECDEPMMFDDFVLTSYPPLYPHKCPNGHTRNLDRAYPRIVDLEEEPNG
jgi:hypothetical protein